MSAGAMRRGIVIVAFGLLTLALLMLPGAGQLVHDEGRTVCARVVETDDSGVELHGMVEFGAQRLRVRLRDGTVREATNDLPAATRRWWCGRRPAKTTRSSWRVTIGG